MGTDWAGREVTDLERHWKKIHYVRSNWYYGPTGTFASVPSDPVTMPNQNEIDAE